MIGYQSPDSTFAKLKLFSVLVCDEDASDSVCATPAKCGTSQRFRRSGIELEEAAIFTVSAELPLFEPK